jgi:hypothetical protein
MFKMNIVTSEGWMPCEIVDLPRNFAKLPIEEIGGLIGVDFLKLRHAKKKFYCELAMRGFQGGRVVEVNDGEYSFEKTVDTDGKDLARPRNVTFKQHPTTRFLEAYVPDTEFNRNVLAKLFFTDSAPYIYNAEVREDVEERAKKLNVQRALKKNLDETVVEVSSKLTEVEKENKRLKKALERMKITNETIKKATGKVTKKNASGEREKILNECIEEAEKEFADVVALLKKSYKDKYNEQSEYKESVLAKAEAMANDIYKTEGLVDVDN